MHSQNAEKFTYIKGRLLYQVVILYNVPFEIGTSLKGKNLLPEGANSLRAVPKCGMKNHFYRIT